MARFTYTCECGNKAAWMLSDGRDGGHRHAVCTRHLNRVLAQWFGAFPDVRPIVHDVRAAGEAR